MRAAARNLSEDADLPSYRDSRLDAASILQVLDSGAIGIMVPHVSSAKMARNIASWARYRAGDYGKRGADDHYDFTDSLTAVIAVIEDAEALDGIDEIMVVDGIDAFFIGRGDLGLSLSNRLGPKATVEEVTLNLFQGPSRDRDQGYRARWMLKQVQHDAFFFGNVC